MICYNPSGKEIFKISELKQVGVIDDYYFEKLSKELENSKENFLKVDNHKYIKSIIDRIPTKLKLKIVNIDFHHDYYHYYKEVTAGTVATG